MDRKEFIGKLGLGAAFVLTTSCLGGCTRDIRELNKLDLKIDLNNPEYSDVLVAGGYVIVEGVVIAQTLNGDYVAASRTCSHEQLNGILYDASNEQWLCDIHGATFTLEGEGLNSNGVGGLAIYQIELDVSNNLLCIFS